MRIIVYGCIHYRQADLQLINTMHYHMYIPMYIILYTRRTCISWSTCSGGVLILVLASIADSMYPEDADND